MLSYRAERRRREASRLDQKVSWDPKVSLTGGQLGPPILCPHRAERRRREASRHKCLRPDNPPRPGQPAAIARYCVAGFGARPVSRKTFIYFSGTKKGDPLRLNVGGPSV